MRGIATGPHCYTMSNDRERIDLEGSVIVLGVVLAVCLVAAIGRFAGII